MIIIIVSVFIGYSLQLYCFAVELQLALKVHTRLTLACFTCLYKAFKTTTIRLHSVYIGQITPSLYFSLDRKILGSVFKVVAVVQSLSLGETPQMAPDESASSEHGSSISVCVSVCVCVCVCVCVYLQTRSNEARSTWPDATRGKRRWMRHFREGYGICCVWENVKSKKEIQ